MGQVSTHPSDLPRLSRTVVQPINSLQRPARKESPKVRLHRFACCPRQPTKTSTNNMTSTLRGYAQTLSAHVRPQTTHRDVFQIS